MDHMRIGIARRLITPAAVLFGVAACTTFTESADNPLGPWELQRSETLLIDAQAREISNALADDESSSPPSAGQRLRSNEFYWAVAACRDGQFRLLAFEQDKVDLKSLPFRGPFLAHDETGIGFFDVERVEGFADNAFEIRINAGGDGITGRF
tara:strand:- start:347 stop:805 length:459 start_codon:yes stop_codon:yes gene_type:complete